MQDRQDWTRGQPLTHLAGVVGAVRRLEQRLQLLRLISARNSCLEQAAGSLGNSCKQEAHRNACLAGLTLGAGWVAAGQAGLLLTSGLSVFSSSLRRSSPGRRWHMRERQ